MIGRPHLNYPYEVLGRDIQEGLPGILPRIMLYNIYDYLGQWLCVGEKLRHEQHPFIHGFEIIPARLLCCVILPQATTTEVTTLVRKLKGRPLTLQDPTPIGTIVDQWDLVNWEVPQYDIWSPVPIYKFQREDLLKQGQAAIRMYLKLAKAELPKVTL